MINIEVNNGAETPDEIMLATQEKVENILKAEFPDYIKFEDGKFTISRGSTQIMIVVRPYTDNDAVIECIANVVYDANITEDLMKFLLRKNAELHFGAFGLLFDDTIVFSYSLAGACLDESELINALNSVATIADYYDDVIVSTNCGKRATDLNVEI